ncbi:MAG: hypothetical protein JRI43_06620 [Deltaproteobacteria bacterium]|nr:hypothetical protein [Deltaproteobacteria bacterium]
MEQTLYDRNGEAVAYIADDFHETVYLWDGSPVAYLYEEQYVYGINGRHLGWFINQFIYNHNGERVGFTSNTSPVPVAKESVKYERRSRDEIRSRWAAITMPKLDFHSADQGLADFLKEGQVEHYQEEKISEEPEE